MNEPPPMRLLLLSRDANWFGGVINLVSMWKAHYSSAVEVNELTIGGRLENSTVRRYLQPIFDAFSLRQVVHERSYDLVHINPSFNLKSLLRDGLFMLVLHRRRVPVLVFFHGWDVRLSEKVLSNAFTRWCFKRSFGRAKRILVLAQEFRYMLEEAGIPAERIYTVTTMFDGRQLQDVPVNDVTSACTVLFLSRFVREKGLFELLDAFASLAEDFPLATLVLAGDGAIRPEVERRVEALALREKVVFTGYVRGQDKRNILQQADIFVLPTYYGEGCPVSMLEAMACGHALVSTPVGGIPDILLDGVNGVMLPSTSSEDIANALRSLMSSPDDLRKISRHNREAAWRRYEAGVVTAGLEEHYSKALSA